MSGGDDGGYARRRADAPAMGVPTTGGLDVGKRALTRGLRTPADADDDYINHGAICDRGDGPGCFLDTDVRTRLVQGFQHRMLGARMSYFHALTKVEVGELLAKDDDIPWWATLLLGIAASQLASGIEAAIGKLKAGIRPTYIRAVNRGAKAKAKITGVLGDMSNDTAKSIGKTLSDAAKDFAKKKGKDSANANHKSKLADTQALIAALESEASLRYQTIMEQSPATADDAQLVALFEGMDEANHSVERYVTEIRSKVDAYKKSRTRDIGYKDGHDADTLRSVEVHTKVAWIRMPAGNTRLVYLEQNFEPKDPDIVYSDEEHLHEDGRRGEDEPRYVDLVEPEFVDVAVQRHETIWATPPKTYDWRLNPGFRIKLDQLGGRQSDAIADAVRTVKTPAMGEGGKR